MKNCLSADAEYSMLFVNSGFETSLSSPITKSRFEYVDSPLPPFITARQRRRYVLIKINLNRQ